MATGAGVARYDGKKFDVYTVDEGLTDNTVFTIWEDSQHRIWMLTYAGIPCFFQDGIIHNPGNTPFLRDLRFDSYLSSIYENKEGIVFLGGKDGKLYSIDPNEKVELIYDSDIYSIYFQFQNNLGEQCFLPNSVKLAVLSAPKPVIHCFLNDTLRGESPRAALLENNDLLLSKGSNLIRLDENYHAEVVVWEKDQNPANQVIQLYQEGPTTWVCTTRGVYEMKLEGNVAIGTKHYFPDLNITSVCRDHEGGFWFSTPNGVLYCSDMGILTNHKPFASIANPVSALASARINGEEVILLGYENGSVSQVSIETQSEKELFVYKAIGSSHRIEQITPLNDRGDLLVNGHEGMAVYRDGALTEYLGFAIHQVASAKDKPDCLCHYGGYIETDLSEFGPGKPGLSQAQKRSAEQNERCFTLTYDRKGRLWVATLNKIVIVDRGQHRSFSFNEHGGATFRPVLLKESPNGEIWLATAGAGLFRFDGKRIYNYLPGNGVPSKIITTLHFDGEGRLWVGTNKGVTYFDLDDDPLNPQVYALNKGDGLPSNNVSAIHSLKNLVLIATDVGLTVYPMMEDGQKELPPLTRITGILVNGKPFKIDDLPRSFSHKENSIGISYTGVSYRSLGEIQYQYRLNGGDSLFHQTKAGFVEYPALPPGEYKFEVESFVPGEKLPSNSAALSFDISAPFWQRTWFVSLVSLLILLVVSAVIGQILRSNRRRHDLINRSLMAEQKLLQAQMNPHFIFNSLNSIQQLFLENKKEVANDYLADFSSMVRMILENVRETTISLTDELRFIKVYLRMESLRLSDQFDFEVSVQPGLPIGNIQIPPMLIQPFLENAIWHGLAPLKERRGVLILKFSKEGGEVICTIRDNGIGRNRSMELKQEYRSLHKSLAMNISRERIETLNSFEKRKASLEVLDEYESDGQAAGTTVILKIPT